MIAGAAWAVPAVVVTVSTPAMAASATSVAFEQVPWDTLACAATRSPMTVRLTGNNVAGAVVQFSLPSGWSWATGSGSYVTNGSGVATVPAGDAIAGATAGYVIATANSTSASAALAVTKNGAIANSTSNVAISSADNEKFLRLYANVSGVTAIKSTGDVWTLSGGAWSKVATGASTEPDSGALLLNANSTDTGTALWLASGGTIMAGSSALTFSSGQNSGFARVVANGQSASAIKCNGDVWSSKNGGSWSLIGTGGATQAGQFAHMFDPGLGNDAPIWIKSGQLQFDNGPASLPSGNSNFVAVISAGTGVTAVKSNGDVWKFDRNYGQGWKQVGTGGSSGPSQIAFLDGTDTTVGSADYAPLWIQSGVLRKASANVSIAASDNQDFLRVYASGSGGATAIKTNGDVWKLVTSSGWSKVGILGGTGPNQAAFGNSPGTLWVQTTNSC